MRRSGFGWWRLAKQVVLGAAEAVASYANSTLVPASNTGSADGTTANTHTLTLRDTTNALMPFKAVTFATELTAVDAAETTLVDDATEIAATTGTLNLILTVRNADGTPLPNIQSARIVYASTGSNNTFGTPSVTDRNGQSLCTFSSTTAEAKTISVTVDGVAITQTAAVTVTGTPGLITPLFASDWRTATGSTDAALRDTSGITAPTVWTVEGGTNVVVANSALGFPAGPTNVLSVPGATGGIIRVSGLTEQAVGVDRYYRLYFRNDLPYPTTDTQTHPFQDGDPGGQINWEFTFLNGSANGADSTHIRLGMQMCTQASGSITYWTGPLLDKATVYRLEWWVEYPTSTTFRIWPRVYNASGTLLYTSSDFNGGGFGGYPAMTLTTFYDTYTFAAFDIANSDGLNVGTNDVYADFAPQYGYQAAVAIADNQGWIGAFGNVDGE